MINDLTDLDPALGQYDPAKALVGPVAVFHLIPASVSSTSLAMAPRSINR
jgi:hypothetical protein